MAPRPRPRLDRFRAALPGIDLRFQLVHGEPVGPIAGVDQAIRFGRPAEGSSPLVEHLLHERYDSLDPQSRFLLEVVAVARVPTSVEVALRVAGTPDGSKAIVALCNQRLLRQSGLAGSHRVEVWHDRIRETLVETLSSEQQVQIHQRFIRDWEEHQPDVVSEPGADAVPYVLHLDAVYRLDQDAVDHERLLDLHHAVGIATRNARAYSSSVNALRRAVAMLPDDGWEQDRARNWAIQLSLAHSLLLDTLFDEVLVLVEDMRPHATTVEERLGVVRIRLQALVARYRMTEALDVAIEALSGFGVNLPRSPGTLATVAALARTHIALRGHTDASLRELPVMTHPESLAALKIMRSVVAPAYIAAPDLFPVLALQMVRTSVKHGLAGDGAVGWATYGMVLASVLGLVEQGVERGRFALHVVDRVGAEDQRAAVLALYGGFIQHWTEPVDATLETLAAGQQAGLAVGELEFAGVCADVHAYYHWFGGKPLDEVFEVSTRAIDVLTRIGQEHPRSVVLRLVQLTANLSGRGSGPPWELNGRWFDGPAVLAQHIEAEDQSSKASLLYFRALLTFMFGDLDATERDLDEAEPDMDALMSTLNHTAFFFLRALTFFARASTQTGLRRWQTVRRARAAAKAVQRGAKACPANHAHAWMLLEAERSHVAGRPLEADYAAAAARASEDGFLHHAALAWECGARALLSTDADAAQRCWHKARDAWSAWGATSRIQFMPAQPLPWPVRRLPSWPEATTT